MNCLKILDSVTLRTKLLLVLLLNIACILVINVSVLYSFCIFQRSSATNLLMSEIFSISVFVSCWHFLLPVLTGTNFYNTSIITAHLAFLQFPSLAFIHLTSHNSP